MRQSRGRYDADHVCGPDLRTGQLLSMQTAQTHRKKMKKFQDDFVASSINWLEGGSGALKLFLFLFDRPGNGAIVVLWL